MLRAVPSTIRIAASTDAAFRSGIFFSAISRTLSRFTVATFLRLVHQIRFDTSCYFKKTAAGGVLVMKVNERSSNTVISTGIIRPA